MPGVQAGVAYVDVLPDFKDFGRQLNAGVEKSLTGVSDKMKTVGSKMAKTGGVITAGVTLPLVAMGKKAFDAASDLNESMSKVDVVFGTSAKNIQDFASSSAKNLGLSRQAALEASGTFGNLFVSMGMAQPAAADMSKGVVSLSSDLASFNNIGTDEALEKLRAGLVGETEPLRALGVNINAATVEAKAMELGLVGANGEISESAKVQARYALILDQTKTAQGDFARTADGAANKQRILRAEFDNAAASLGNNLLPIGQQLLGWVGGLVEKFNGLSPTMQKVVLAGAALLAAVGPLVTIIGGLVAGIGFLISPIGLVVAAIAALVAGAIYAYKNFESFRNVVDGVVSWLKDTVPAVFAQVRDAIVGAFEWVRSNVVPIVEAVVSFILERFGAFVAWVQQVWPQVSEAIGHVMEVVQGIIRTVIDVISAIWRAWGDDLLKIVKTAFDFIRQTVENVINIVRGIIEFVLALINGDWSKAWEAIKGVLAAVWDQIKNIVSTAFDFVKSLIGGALSTVAEVWRGAWNGIKDFLAGIWDSITGAVSRAMDGVRNTIQGAVDGIKGIWDGLMTIFKTPINIVIGFVNTLIRGANTILDKVGAGTIPTLPSLHTGGVVGKDKGSRLGRTGPLREDEEIARLQKGEGVLPLNAMKMLGPDGFEALRGGGKVKLPLESDVLPEWGGFPGSGVVKNLVGKGLDVLIDIAGGIVTQVTKSIVQAGNQFGTVGKMVAYGPKKAGVGVAVWLAELKKSLDEATGQAGTFGTGSTINRLIGVVKSSGVPHRVTSTKRNGTGSSYHNRGRAVDFAGPSPGINTPALGNIFKAFRNVEGSLAELIYAGPQVSYNIKNGKRVGKYSQALHKNHVHAAMALGGVFDSPWTGTMSLAERGTEIVTPENLMREIVGESNADVVAVLSEIKTALAASRPITLVHQEKVSPEKLARELARALT